MRHAGGVLHETFDTSEAHSEVHDPQSLTHLLGSLQRHVTLAFDNECNHPAIRLRHDGRILRRISSRTECLCNETVWASSLIVRMGRQTWVKCGFDQRVRLEHPRYLEGVLAVPLHAHVQRSDAAHQQVRVHGIERGSDELLNLGDAMAELGALARDRPGEDVGVPTQVLRAGLNGDIDSGEVQWPHVVRRGERPVDHDPGTVRVAYSCSIVLVNRRAHTLQIGDATGGIGWRLAVHHLGILAKCRAVRLRALLPRAVDEIYFNSPVNSKFL
mmetsp:Transcript_26119/g.55558  ORF Transcript_26119/g.55558 Transcript_26119/m.55558 type:complete len:272 (+) Transcript_26119:526-1341(+)